MKKSTLALAIGLLLVANNGFAKTQKMTLEQRLEQLEARLEAAENRAAKAENQVQQLQVQQAAEIQKLKLLRGIRQSTALRLRKRPKRTPPPLTWCSPAMAI